MQFFTIMYFNHFYHTFSCHGNKLKIEVSYGGNKVYDREKRFEAKNTVHNLDVKHEFIFVVNTNVSKYPI